MQDIWISVKSIENHANLRYVTMKQLKKLFREIYLYYGVTSEDIKNETERYKSLLAVLCS